MSTRHLQPIFCLWMAVGFVHSADEKDLGSREKPYEINSMQFEHRECDPGVSTKPDRP